MKVFKFGGASIQDTERIQNVKNILRSHHHEQIIVIISAMGKTTNALEKVAESFYKGERENALQLFGNIKTDHLALLDALVTSGTEIHTATLDRLGDHFTEIEWLLHDTPKRDHDYYYDQIVCCGELLSTTIISGYLQAEGLSNTWLDARDIICTDDSFREGIIDWGLTKQRMSANVAPLFASVNLVITQGFIGTTPQNESTTLGREGSDYSAAVFANMLDAESLTIWKDVEGIMNADPKKYEKAIFIEKMSYKEVIELAYHGAQVIHPKTIKPLQNKNIPLHVRCFVKPELKGTVINGETVSNLPPIIIAKEDQLLVSMRTKDFSLMGEPGICELYKLLANHKVKPVLTQHEAVGFHCCYGGRIEKIQRFIEDAARIFDVQVQKDLTLLTVRHYNDEILAELSADKSILLKQRSPETAQFLFQQP